MPCVIVSTLLSGEVTNCCSIDFGFAIFPPFMFPVLFAFLYCMHFIERSGEDHR